MKKLIIVLMAFVLLSFAPITAFAMEEPYSITFEQNEYSTEITVIQDINSIAEHTYDLKNDLLELGIEEEKLTDELLNSPHITISTSSDVSLYQVTEGDENVDTEYSLSISRSSEYEDAEDAGITVSIVAYFHSSSNGKYVYKVRGYMAIPESVMYRSFTKEDCFIIVADTKVNVLQNYNGTVYTPTCLQSYSSVMTEWTLFGGTTTTYDSEYITHSPTYDLSCSALYRVTFPQDFGDTGFGHTFNKNFYNFSVTGDIYILVESSETYNIVIGYAKNETTFGTSLSLSTSGASLSISASNSCTIYTYMRTIDAMA